MSTIRRTLDHRHGPDARDERNKAYRITRLVPGGSVPLAHEKTWRGGPVLDQGQTGHCGGFGAADEAGASPVRVRVSDDWAHAFYYGIKDAGLDPASWGREGGTSVQSVMKFGRMRGLWPGYGWAFSLDDLDAGLEAGPAIVGTDWPESAFTPHKGGLLDLSGTSAGGHCYIVTGKINSPTVGRIYRIRNSWGHGWGSGGNAYVKREEFGALLFGADGECAIPTGRTFPED